MNYEQLFEQIKKKKSFLCVGLDPDIEKMSPHLLNMIPEYDINQVIFYFNKAIIDATHDLAIAYKPNLAFYECHGLEGWKALEKTVTYIRNHYPEIFIIADAKRGDIGNTSKMYAKAFFERMNVDAITVAPYMGSDSIEPFLAFEKKWVILLALTSNKGADDFQHFDNEEGVRLFERILAISQKWAGEDRMMYVVGATRANELTDIRKFVPNHFLLVPGVGAQGGSLEEVSKYGMNNSCGLIINSSRAIIHADRSEDFAQVARKVTIEYYQQPMEKCLREKGLIE